MAFTPSQQDKPIYDFLWTAAFQTNNIPIANEIGAPAVHFLKRSGVDTGILKQIWSLSTPNPTMNINEFYTAIRYIVMFQNGEKPLTKERLISTANEKFEPPKFQDIKLPLPVPINNTASVIPPNNPTSGPALYAITPEDHEKYHKLFITYDTNGDGLLSGTESVGILTKSGLTQDVLGVIWNLADDDKDGSLTSKEFCVAFHLIICISKRGMPVPQTLPPALNAFLQNAPAVPVPPAPVAAPVVPVSVPVNSSLPIPSSTVPTVPSSVNQPSLSNSSSSISSLEEKPAAPKVSSISNIPIVQDKVGLSEREEAELMSDIVTIKSATQKALDITDKAIETSSKGMESLRTLMQKLQAEKVAIKSKLEAADQATKEADSKMESIVTEISELQSELSKLRKDLDEAKEKEMESRMKATGPKVEEKQQLIRQLEETKKQISILKNGNLEFNNSISDLNREKGELDSKLKPIVEEETKLVGEINSLKADINVLTNELNNLNKDNNTKQNELASIERDVKNMQASLLDKHHRIKSLNDQKDDLHEEKESLVQKVEDLKASD